MPSVCVRRWWWAAYHFFVVMRGDFFFIAVGRVLLQCYRRFRKGSLSFLARSKLETRIRLVNVFSNLVVGSGLELLVYRIVYRSGLD